jgi:DNA polymerase III gamma/tau subunit
MTREDIMRMAKEVWSVGYVHERSLEKFAALVAAHEREACAAACDEYAANSSHPMNFASNCAEAIRARG